MTWQDLKNVARYTYGKSRDAAYEKLQKRKSGDSVDKKHEILFLVICFVCGLSFGAFVGAWRLGVI